MTFPHPRNLLASIAIGGACLGLGLTISHFVGGAPGGRRPISAQESVDGSADSVASLPDRLLPDLTLSLAVTGRQVRLLELAGAGRVGLWFFSTSDCLYCLADVYQWNQLAKDSVLRIVGIASGADTIALKEFVSTDARFSVLRDPDQLIRRAIGAPLNGQLRLVAVDGVIALADAGRKAIGPGVLRQASILFREQALPSQPYKNNYKPGGH